MKMKKILSSVVALTLLVVCAAPSLALENLDADKEEEIVFKTSLLLQFMEPEKSLNGMGDVDFSNLYLGDMIPSYILSETGTVESTEILNYPILEGDDWVATALVSESSSQQINVQIGTKYSDTYNDYGLEGEVALLFDSSSAYMVTENEIIKFADSHAEIAGRANLDDVNVSAVQGILELGEISANQSNKLECSADLPLQTFSTLAFDTSRYLDVPLVQQSQIEGDKQCWAACIVSVCGYYGQNKSIDEVYTDAGVSYSPNYDYADINTAEILLESYGYICDKEYVEEYSWFDLTRDICAYEAPVYAAVRTSEVVDGVALGHAVLIRGYITYQVPEILGSISYMDPETGEYDYTTVEFEGDYAYVDEETSERYPIEQLMAVLDV